MVQFDVLNIIYADFNKKKNSGRQDKLAMCLTVMKILSKS